MIINNQTAKELREYLLSKGFEETEFVTMSGKLQNVEYWKFDGIEVQINDKQKIEVQEKITYLQQEVIELKNKIKKLSGITE